MDATIPNVWTILRTYWAAGYCRERQPLIGRGFNEGRRDGRTKISSPARQMRGYGSALVLPYHRTDLVGYQWLADPPELS